MAKPRTRPIAPEILHWPFRVIDRHRRSLEVALHVLDLAKGIPQSFDATDPTEWTIYAKLIADGADKAELPVTVSRGLLTILSNSGGAPEGPLSHPVVQALYAWLDAFWRLDVYSFDRDVFGSPSGVSCRPGAGAKFLLAVARECRTAQDAAALLAGHYANNVCDGTVCEILPVSANTLDRGRKLLAAQQFTRQEEVDWTSIGDPWARYGHEPPCAEPECPMALGHTHSAAPPHQPPSGSAVEPVSETPLRDDVLPAHLEPSASPAIRRYVKTDGFVYGWDDIVRALKLLTGREFNPATIRRFNSKPNVERALDRRAKRRRIAWRELVRVATAYLGQPPTLDELSDD